MKKILLGLMLGLSFAAVQASLIDPALSRYMSQTGSTLAEARDAVYGQQQASTDFVRTQPANSNAAAQPVLGSAYSQKRLSTGNLGGIGLMR